VFVLAIPLLLSGCAAQSGIEVREPWMRPGTQGGNGAVYFIVQNHSSEEDEIVSIRSDAAAAVEIHESKMEGDVMQMQQLASVPLQSGAEVTFQPGGLHIMLVGLKNDINMGDEIELTLQFKNYEDIKVSVPVSEGLTPAQEH
jgi:copper(I)-binding protein